MVFALIDKPGDTYYSGGRFISAVREVDAYFPDYQRYIEDRKASGKSTSRKNYFYDVLMGFSETDRTRLVTAVLRPIAPQSPNEVAEIKAALSGLSAVPMAEISTYIKSFADVRLSDSEVITVYSKLTGLKSDPALTRTAHLESLRVRHESTSKCPRCGSALVERMSRSGANAGNKFLGCETFPRCRFTKPL